MIYTCHAGVPPFCALSISFTQDSLQQLSRPVRNVPREVSVQTEGRQPSVELVITPWRGPGSVIPVPQAFTAQPLVSLSTPVCMWQGIVCNFHWF